MRNTAWHPVAGEVVKRGDTYVVMSARGDTWPIERVQFIMGGWGFDEDGVAKLPRPSVYAENGTKTVKGDALLIQFLEGNPRKPVAMAGLRSVKSDDFLPLRHERGVSANRLALRLRVRDEDSGADQGVIELELAADDKPSVRLLVEDRIDLELGKDGEVKATITAKDGAVHVDGKLTVEDTAGTAKKLVNEDALPRLAGLLRDLGTPSNWTPAAPGTPPTLNPGFLVTYNIEVAKLQQKLDTTSDLKGA